MAKKKIKKISKVAETEADFPFEEAMKRIETIVLSLESGELNLGESLARYEEAVGQLKRCHQYLEHAERQVNVLAGVDEDGNPLVQPMEDGEAQDLVSKQSARSRKRGATRRASKPTGDEEPAQEGESGGLF